MKKRKKKKKRYKDIDDFNGIKKLQKVILHDFQLHNFKLLVSLRHKVSSMTYLLINKLNQGMK